jgi:hypothetical protein
MKSIPDLPGGLLMSKPTRSSTEECWTASAFFVLVVDVCPPFGLSSQEIAMSTFLALSGVWIGGGTLGVILVVVIAVLLLRR